MIAVSTLAYQGYPLLTAVEELAKLEVNFVELAFIRGYSSDLQEEYFSAKNARKIRNMLADFGLLSSAISAHLDLGSEGSSAAFTRRMEFAKEVGARVINTNATECSKENVFLDNVEKLADLAETFDLIIGLENPGDGQYNLIGSGEEGVSVLKKIGSPRVRLNYDFANIYSYSKGNLLPEHDLELALPLVAHLHFKDLKPDQQGWCSCGIGRGVINYQEIFNRFETLTSIPGSIELPLWLRRTPDFIPQIEHSLIELPKITRVLRESVEFIRTVLSIPLS